MHITITQENLHKALQLVGRIVGTRANLPVLANVLLQSENGRLKLAATDLEIGLITRIGAKVDKEGAITVPCRAFAEFIATIVDDKVTLESDGAVLKVSSAHAKASFRGIDAEEFPVIPTVDASAIDLPAMAFIAGVKQVVVAVAPDDTRPVLSGVLIRVRANEMRLVATDSYRLAEKTIKLDVKADDQEAIIPAKSINELARITASLSAESMTCAIKDSQILFSLDDTVLVSRIIDGKYPDYEKIIPQSLSTKAIIDNDQFKNTVRAATIFARESANTVKVQFGPEAIITMSATAESLGSTSVTVDCEISGPEAASAFNIRYLSDAASVIGDEKIEFGLSGELAPGLIKGTVSKDFLYVIMPLKNS